MNVRLYIVSIGSATSTASTTFFRLVLIQGVTLFSKPFCVSLNNVASCAKLCTYTLFFEHSMNAYCGQSTLIVPEQSAFE